jgi:hypothetical protein
MVLDPDTYSFRADMVTGGAYTAAILILFVSAPGRGTEAAGVEREQVASYNSACYGYVRESKRLIYCR